MDGQYIQDSSDLRRYRTELPNLIDDIGLSVYAYRLYGHFKRVCGASPDGRCWQNTRTLAEHCRMSVGQVSKAKQELIAYGLISIDKQPHPTKPASDVVTLVDIWMVNMMAYAPGQEDACSSGEQACSQSEQPCSSGETKKEPMLRTNPVKNDDDLTANQRKGAQPQTPQKSSSPFGEQKFSTCPPESAVSSAPLTEEEALALIQSPAVQAHYAAFGEEALSSQQLRALAGCTNMAAVNATIADYKGHPHWRRDNIAVFVRRYNNHLAALDCATAAPSIDALRAQVQEAEAQYHAAVRAKSPEQQALYRQFMNTRQRYNEARQRNQAA